MFGALSQVLKALEEAEDPLFPVLLRLTDNSRAGC